MNNIKVGDKLFSKKSSGFIIKNKYYTIKKIDKSQKELLGFDVDIKFTRYVQIGSENTFLHDFVLNKPNHEDYIWNYFYTPNELRKEKIKKLNE